MPIDNAELVELRARTRTDASYSRTALGMLSYSVIILKIFDRRFYRSKSIFFFGMISVLATLSNVLT